MRRAYQKQAAKGVVQPTAERAVQISLPMAEVLTSIEQGLGELVRKVGRMFIESVLEAEVEQIAGPRSCPHASAAGIPLGCGARLLSH